MRSRLTQVTFLALGVALALCSSSSPAFASVTVPEIDGASITAGLGLLGSGVMMLRARLRNR